MQWLVVSLVLSAVLTVLLNVAVRVFPGRGERAAQRLAEPRRPRDDRGVQVFVPWKAMLLASVVLTIAINVVLWLT